MATTSAYIAALENARVLVAEYGVAEVTTPEGTTTKFQSLADLDAALARARADLSRETRGGTIRIALGGTEL